MLSSAARLAFAGIRQAITAAIPATAAPMRRPVWNPPSLGIGKPPRSVVICASTTPTTAADTDVPTERIRVLTLVADAVSDRGTEPMIRAGIAPYARPTPELTTHTATSRPQVE